MFNNLYKLYKKSATDRTPLEDYNTECFSELLQFYPSILNSFVEFLNLPEGNYKVFTQSKYNLSNDPNCIIDMVLESESVICFIENKVNSKEGWEQLTSYGKVLDSFKKKQTYLKYCTKHLDEWLRNNKN